MWGLVCGNVRAEGVIGCGACVGFAEREDQRCACIIVPDFNGIDVVPVTCRAVLEQKIDAGACGPSIVSGGPCLAVIAPLGMGAKFSFVMISSAVI